MGKKLTLVRQTENAECGVACLAMIAGKINKALRAKLVLHSMGCRFLGLLSVRN